MNQDTTRDPLDGALHEWRVTSALPPRFQETVWQRIERREASRVTLFDLLKERMAAVFARPAFAIAYVTALLFAGLTLGFTQARHESARWDQQLEARYVQAIDPYHRLGE